MKLKFKTQAYQSAAVQAVVDCFEGQVARHGGMRHRIDAGAAPQSSLDLDDGLDATFRNADVSLSHAELLENIRKVQRRQNLTPSAALATSSVADINLDVEMETGTGKTYCYIKTIFELNRRYGWSKFIIVVPSIAIREGVARSLEITADHFLETYHKKARFFIYNSKLLPQLESFASDAGINVMVINVQAFNATGQDARRIYEMLDDFGSRRPIDVISANRPILILDEPQKMEGDKTLDSLARFKPLMVLRYSATHRTTHDKIHRLDALDAYNQKLVKKIAVRGISVKGLAGANAYLYLQSIEVAAGKAPLARIELEIKSAGGAIRRAVRKIGKGDNLFFMSNELEQYRHHVVADIDAIGDSVEFTNGASLAVGEAVGDVDEATLRRIQIREAVKAHFDKEEALFGQGIKVLTLFFIDKVAKYRDYDAPDGNGEYARMFEEEYLQYRDEVLASAGDAYARHLRGIAVERTHHGYFSLDRKSRKLVDPALGKKGGEADDVDAYDLILRDKERLLSLDEPVRFIFSHSALREGWDNPNVFVICTLKHSDNKVSRHQEVGRGLRLAVDRHGERMDQPDTVHDINVLTVVASESYKDFVATLQKEFSASLSARPRSADKAYFSGKVVDTPDGRVALSDEQANEIEFYLIRNGYVDARRFITEQYHRARKDGTLAPLPDALQALARQVFGLVDSVFSDAQSMQLQDGRRAKKLTPNANFDKREFRDLWERINRKASYSVQFDSAELVAKAVAALDAQLRVAPLQYTIQRGEQAAHVTYDGVKSGESFVLKVTDHLQAASSAASNVKYDVVGQLADGCKLTRRTVVEILRGVQESTFAQFGTNPEAFIAGAVRLIDEQKASVIIEHLAYDTIEERFALDIFSAGQTGRDLSQAGGALQRHIYDYVLTDSQVERDFVTELDTSTDVVVYAKLPRGFLIPTPVGDYNPDWAISFREGTVKHVYFVAETKGSLSSMVLNDIEKTKIACARKFFEQVNRRYLAQNVRYDVVNDFQTLMEIVK